jgi:hypothetical protein
VAIIRAAEEFKNLDEAIVRNCDVVLLTTLNIIYRLYGSLKESPFGDAGRQQVSVAFLQFACVYELTRLVTVGNLSSLSHRKRRSCDRKGEH